MATDEDQLSGGQAMTENFTREHKLVEDISSKGWFANPAGRQGYEVIILEQVGDGGTHFYHSLRPGETLRLGERLFGRFIALAVDVRHARKFPVEGHFAARERGRKVTVQVNVRYRVTDARVVAMETLDPLGELRDKVIATLNRELARYPEGDINPALIERVILSVGPAPHLGLTVEGAEVIEFTPDSRLTEHVVQEEDLHHELSIGGIKSEAEIEEESRKREAEIRWRQEEHAAIDLSDISVLMHQYPDLIPQIFSTFAERDRRLLEAQIDVVAPAVQAYIQQQRDNGADIDPEEIARIMRQAIAPSRAQLQSPVNRQIVWGDQVVDAVPSSESQIKFEEDEIKEKRGKKPPEDPDRIKFSD
jgi:hypothetical protein